MKQDPRIIKTKKAIEDAFISLVQVKGYKNVKLTDIAEKARVNRNTIYLHYASKEDIIKSIIASALGLDSETLDMKKALRARANRIKISGFFKLVFDLINKNAELYRVLLMEDQLVGFFLFEIKRVKTTMYKLVKQNTKNDIVLDYFVFGVFGVLANYIVYAKGTTEENIRYLTDLTVATMRRIQL